MNERLKFLFSSTGKKQIEFARLLYDKSINPEESMTEEEEFKNLKNKQSYVSGLINGNNKIGVGTILNILELFPDLNLNWFILGKGDIFIQQSEQSIVAEPVATYNKSQVKTIEILETQLHTKDQEIQRLLGIIEKIS